MRSAPGPRGARPGLLLALALGVALAAAAPAAASEERPTPAELESELVCPVCDSTLDTSNAPVARRMKEVIRERIEQGRTKSEIKAEFVDQFGPGVLATPSKQGLDLVAWVLPLLGLATATVAVGLLSWRWSRRRDVGDGTGEGGSGGDQDGGAPDVELDSELERRLDGELARFE